MVSIFTPTYNRAHTLKNLYVSLCNQTCMDFEWIVVDDGSTDNTKELIDSFCSERKIRIKYISQKNQGKAVAHNIGVVSAEGELFTCVDSDDMLDERAVERVILLWKTSASNIIGLVLKRKNRSGLELTQMSTNIVEYSSLRKMYKKKKLKGDTFLIFRTDVVKKYKFPQWPNEKFVPEDYLYDQMEKEGVLRFVNEALYIGDYLSDGYTHNMNKIIANNPKGYRAFILNRIEMEEEAYHQFGDLIRYSSIAFVLGENYILKKHFLFSLIAFLPGYVLYNIRFKNICK